MPPLRISVLIPTFNQARYLEEALACVLGQSYAPFEVAVVDDGSTDETGDLLEAYQDRVRYYRQENQGIGGARNQCLALARGDTLAFLDADDLWPERSLEVRAEVLQQNPELDGVVGMVEQFLSPEAPEEIRRQLNVSHEPTVVRLAGSMLLRRRAFDKVGGFNATLKVGDTLDWLARAEGAGVRIAPLQELVLLRRIHGGNTVIRLKSEQSDYLRVLKAALDRRRVRAKAAPVDGRVSDEAPGPAGQVEPGA